MFLIHFKFFFGAFLSTFLFVTFAKQQTLPYNKTCNTIDLYKFDLIDGVRCGEIFLNMKRTPSALFADFFAWMSHLRSLVTKTPKSRCICCF